MRKLFILFALVSLNVFAVDRLTLTVTVTNTPADGNLFTVNSDQRTNKTTVTVPSKEVLIGGSIGAQTTNLWLHITANPFTGLIPQWVATNQIKLIANPGNALSASAGGTWATLTVSTQSFANANFVTVPFTSEPTVQVRTNHASQLVDGISTYSTNSFAATATALANHVNINQAQTIAGHKTWNANLNTYTNSSIELYLSNIDFLTNSILRFWPGAYLQFDTNVNILDSGGATKWAFTAVDATNKVSTLLDITNRITSLKAAVNTWSAANTFSGANVLSGSIAGGTFTSPGLTNAASTNGAYRGTQTFTSAVLYTRVNNTSLANGNNAGVDFGSETVFVKIKAGPTGAFTLNGIAGGANGRILKLYNSTGQNLTFANESGVDATPANRIITMTGADVTGTANSAAELIYDTDSSRWILINHEP